VAVAVGAVAVTVLTGSTIVAVVVAVVVLTGSAVVVGVETEPVDENA
jgi:hypothetical protein